MENIKHWAIYGSGLSIDSPFIKRLISGKAEKPFQSLANKKGELFSNSNLQKFIKEEITRDDFSLTSQENRSIRTFSSGEQRKALLNYLLAKKPDFLIIDNAFDMLDKDSQQDLALRLKDLSKEISIIQIFRRINDLQNFIPTVLRIENDEITYSGSPDDYRKQFSPKKYFEIIGDIPPALTSYKEKPNPLLAFKNVSVKYGDKQILNKINWEIKKGEFWQLIGPNGAGKTTLLTMVSGDNPKAYGQDITIFGRKKGSGESIWEIKKTIGYVTPAMTTLFEGWHNVEKMIISGFYDSIGLYKKPSYSEEQLAEQWMKITGLNAWKKTRFRDLPQEKQCMVLIIRAMIKHPPLLILDEPTQGLDDDNVAILNTLVNKIAKESQTTIIYVSHKLEKELKPDFRYELTAENGGSVGKVV